MNLFDILIYAQMSSAVIGFGVGVLVGVVAVSGFVLWWGISNGPHRFS